VAVRAVDHEKGRGVRVKLRELRALTREMASDTTAPFLWSNDFIDLALNDAQWQACRRARLIIDSTTPRACRINLAASQPLYRVDPSVIFIRRVKLSTRSDPLGFARVRDMDLAQPDWESETGEVVGWVADHTTGKLRLYRIPTAAELPAVATLTVVRGPLAPMAKDEDAPEIHERHHYNLHHWALFRMYSKQDSQTYDPKRAADNMALFEADFGQASTAIEEHWIDSNFDYGEELGVF
jgi:hypothetical protein